MNLDDASGCIAADNGYLDWRYLWFSMFRSAALKPGIFMMKVTTCSLEAPNGADRYEANYARGRIDGAGQLALHVLPSDAFGLELGMVYGLESNNFDIDKNGDRDTNDDNIPVNVVGIRPVILTKFGSV